MMSMATFVAVRERQSRSGKSTRFVMAGGTRSSPAVLGCLHLDWCRWVLAFLGIGVISASLYLCYFALAFSAGCRRS